jgi:hypothetical protein
MIRAEALLVDGQGAPVKRLGFLQLIGGFQQQRQIVEVGRHSWVVRAEAQLVDSQGAPIKRFGFVWPVDRLEQLRQIIEVAGDPWMVRAAG